MSHQQNSTRRKSMSDRLSNKKIADIVRDFCLSEGYEFYPDYSGRAMYGGKCIGISHKDTTATVMLRLARHIMDYLPQEPLEINEALRRLENSRQDNLGLGTITYWPDIEAADAVSEK
jgi:hypothetical protein